MKNKVYFACIAALLAIAPARAEPEPQPQAQSQPDNTQLDNIRRAISETEKRLADRHGQKPNWKPHGANWHGSRAAKKPHGRS